MNTKKKHIGITVALAVAIMATVLVGYASATGVEYAANSTAYSFWIAPQPYAVTDMATPRTKASSNSYAYYYLTTVTNTTGYNCYLNVRTGDGYSIAGYPKSLGNGATGYYQVYYRSGYGNVGSSYRPSGQTNSNAAKSAYIEGSWIP